MDFDLSGLKDRATKKIGPLPLWVWAIIIVGVGYAGYRVFAARSGGGTTEDPYAADTTSPEDNALAGYSSGFAETPSNSGGSTGGLSSGGGGSSYTPTPNDLLDSAAIGMASNPYNNDNPLPVTIQGVNPNLYTGTPYAPIPNQGDTGGGGGGSAPPAAPDNSGLRNALANAKSAEQAAQAELSAAKDAERAAQANLSAAKQSGKGVAAAQAAKDAAAARSGVAQANKDAAAAASGVAQANLNAAGG